MELDSPGSTANSVCLVTDCVPLFPFILPLKLTVILPGNLLTSHLIKQTNIKQTNKYMNNWYRYWAKYIPVHCTYPAVDASKQTNIGMLSATCMYTACGIWTTYCMKRSHKRAPLYIYYGTQKKIIIIQFTSLQLPACPCQIKISKPGCKNLTVEHECLTCAWRPGYG